MTTVMDALTDIMDSRPTLPLKVSITFDTMLNFDCDFDGHRDGKANGQASIEGRFTCYLPVKGGKYTRLWIHHVRFILTSFGTD